MPQTVYNRYLFRYDKVHGFSAATYNNNKGDDVTVTVVCTKEQVKTVDVLKSDVEKPQFVGWTFAVFEEIYFHEVSERLINRKLFSAFWPKYAVFRATKRALSTEISCHCALF